MTLDLYSHLFPDRLDELADRLDDAVSASDVDQGPTGDDEEGDEGRDAAARLHAGPRSSGDRAPLS
jgi:hypothetical protein